MTSLKCKVRKKISLRLHSDLETSLSEALNLTAEPLVDEADRLHRFRVATKQLRADLRLLRRGLGGKNEDPSILFWSRQLRKASRLMSPYRDWDVMLENAHHFLPRLESEKDRKHMQDWIELRQREKDERDRNRARDFKKAIRLLEGLKKHPLLASECRLRRKAAERSLRKSLDKAYRAYRFSLKSERDEDLHELRKRLKDLQFQLAVGVGKKDRKVLYGRIKDVAQVIGEDRDLTALQSHLTTAPSFRQAHRKLDGRRKKLRDKALKKARGLFQDWA